ncbi:MAG: DUF1326 domain-containing protein [Pseudomonadota bacterium]|nr:DUF1326 domain-containing protein [Pseudomonadota bacterium]
MADWNVKGNYFESCNCDLVCPCIFLEPPTEGFCEAQVGWHIEEGNYNGVDLSDRKVGVWLHAPCKGENKNLTDGGWSLALYVDDGASDEQFNAICELWSGKGGGHLAIIASLVGEVISAEKAPINIEISEKGRSLTIGDVGHEELVAVDGADGGPVLVKNMPLAVAPPYDIQVFRSVKNTYTGNGKNFSQTNKVGLASPFSYGP